MKENKIKKGDYKSKTMKSYAGIILSALIFLGIILLFPERKDVIISESKKYFIEMLLIIPPVMISIGLFSVWVSKDLISKYLGKESGIKGAFISIIVGSLPMGPLYIAFPIASSLVKKGASLLNIIVFLGAWACLKIPQGLVELKFLGLKFMILRWSFSIILIILMGYIIEKIIEVKKIDIIPSIK
ncbi:MAG: putative permease [Candidatus Methanofastidiosum methylothiophilum]|uniref:Putative permease n=1 Tax=Candidatus Methanofastidiosum methylothiophilum TaxID=1705564 RepID=A0A150J775_9EURY|nr:MAG: putative permease [Candidatus Methanofastidiosum methylthiophilus]